MLNGWIIYSVVLHVNLTSITRHPWVTYVTTCQYWTIYVIQVLLELPKLLQVILELPRLLNVILGLTMVLNVIFVLTMLLNIILELTMLLHVLEYPKLLACLCNVLTCLDYYVIFDLSRLLHVMLSCQSSTRHILLVYISGVIRDLPTLLLILVCHMFFVYSGEASTFTISARVRVRSYFSLCR